MPVIQGTDDWSDAISAPPYAAVFGTPTKVTTLELLYQDTPRSLEIDSPGNEGARRSITGSPSRGWMGIPFRIPANPSGGALTVAAMHSVTSNIQARLAVSTAGVIHTFIGAGSSANGPTLTLGAFYWVELQYDVSAATHRLLWWVNGAPQTAATVEATESDSVDYGQLVSLSGGGTVTWHAGGKWKWGSAGSDDDVLGEPSLAHRSQTLDFDYSR